MQLTTNKYALILTVESLLLFIDLGTNITSLITKQNNALMLILFIVQDVCLILALAILLLTFFSTYVFQTGLVYLLYERFKGTLIVCMTYIVMTTILHIWTLIVKWNTGFKYQWSLAFLLFLIAHRFTAALYYYYYKRAALRISDPRFYEDMDMRQSSCEINQ